MKSTMFGSMVAGAVAGLMFGGIALADDAKKEEKAAPKMTKEPAKAAAGAGWCKSNKCAHAVAGAKNSCQGHNACEGITEAKCKEGGHGTWTTEPKPG